MANEQTSVPLFVADTILTAAQQNISAGTGVPVFATTVTRDAAFGGANKALAEGQLCYLSATNVVQQYNGTAWEAVGASKFVQQVATQVGTMATGTGLIPFDNTIPQNTEGDQYMTLAITPTSATNILTINVIAVASNSIANTVTMALFQDSTANALATVFAYQGTATGGLTIPLNHRMTSGTTSATTFKIRIGALGASTTTFNGTGGAAYYGGTFASTIIITETST